MLECGKQRQKMSAAINYRYCDSCDELYLDNGVELIYAADKIEDGPNEIWCHHCLDNYLDHQSKYYDESDVSEADEWHDFDPDC